jgi:hypothetical protein
MNLNEILSSSMPAVGVHGQPGVESDWHELAPFTLRGRHLQMVEKRIIGASGRDTIVVEAQPGEHVVECKVVTYGGVDARICRMRVRPVGATPALGGVLGTISVDLGGIAVADIDVLGRARPVGRGAPGRARGLDRRGALRVGRAGRGARLGAREYRDTVR